MAEQREERFKDINAAYRVLSDPERRAQYDRAREARAGARRERVFVDEGPGVGFGGLGEDLGIDLLDRIDALERALRTQPPGAMRGRDRPLTP